MSLKRKLEGEVEIRATAADIHHEMYTSKPHHVSIASPQFAQGVDLHEGTLGTPGSKTIWKYTLGGKPQIAKLLINEIDDEKKLHSVSVLEGNLKEEYKSCTVTCQVIPKDKETCIVRWTIEYEKLHPGIPEPTALMDSLLNAATHIDDHHHGKK